MISIHCTSCKTLLEMDDAFAGGVCRCQHCGTIQTVPTASKRSATPVEDAVSNQPLSSGKSLYTKRRTNNVASEGSEIATSSGLTRGGLQQQPRVSGTDVPAEEHGQPAAKSMLIPILIGAIGAAILAGIVVVIALLVLHKPTATTSSTNETEVVTGPSFGGVKLTEPSVVYVLDRGNSTRDFFDPLRAATYRSLELIGADKKFAVILTNNGNGEQAYPKEGLASSTATEIDALRRDIEDVVADGNSHLRGALDKAIARRPAVIVVASGKYLLDDDDAAALRDAASKGIKINTFALGSSAGSTAMEEAASSSGGTYRKLNDGQLRSLSSSQ